MFSGGIMKEIMEEYSSVFYSCMQEWPENIKKDIYKLYAYLRAMDEIVEHNNWHPKWSEICNDMDKLEKKYNFEPQWNKDFNRAMLSDLGVTPIAPKKHTLKSMLQYCVGSAESVALMISRILGCPPEANDYARSLGRAYQIINFVRDYDDDTSRGYHYIEDNFPFYIKMFKNDLRKAKKGMFLIPAHLRGAIYKTTEKYMEVADDRLD